MAIHIFQLITRFLLVGNLHSTLANDRREAENRSSLPFFRKSRRLILMLTTL